MNDVNIQDQFARDCAFSLKTNAELAEEYEVSPNTVRNWKRTEWYADLMQEFHDALNCADDYMRVLIENQKLREQFAKLKGM